MNALVLGSVASVIVEAVALLAGPGVYARATTVDDAIVISMCQDHLENGNPVVDNPAALEWPSDVSVAHDSPRLTTVTAHMDRIERDVRNSLTRTNRVEFRCHVHGRGAGRWRYRFVSGASRTRLVATPG